MAKQANVLPPPLLVRLPVALPLKSAGLAGGFGVPGAALAGDFGGQGMEPLIASDGAGDSDG